MIYSALTGGAAMTDERLDQIIGNLLRAGVAVAALVVAAGGIWYLVAVGAAPADFRHFHATPGWRLWTALTGPEIVILAGLLILVATPIARVGFSLVAFALEHDFIYVGITLLVLIVLLYSIVSAWL